MPRDYIEQSRSVKLTHIESKRFYKFTKRHRKCIRPLFRLTCNSTGGIGVVTYVHCSECKKKRNITDYKCW